MTVRSPKLLPWLARKAGIRPERAEVLWQRACREAARQAPEGSSAYFKHAVDSLIAAVAEETLRADAASLGWRPLLRAQQRLWGATLQLWEMAGVLSSRGLRAVVLSVPDARG